MSGTLFIVATPIGNMEDLTPRARQTLADVDLIAAEDTRHTGRLLSTIGVKTPQKALHDHNESQVVGALVEMLQAGKNIALVSDAGTPLVSDPGYRLVMAAHESNIAVSPIPGPSSLTAALSVAGLPTDRFCFEGFAPAKSKARKTWFEARATETGTLIFFESVHRIRESVADMLEIFGADRQAFIGREITKLHEQCVRGSLRELLRGIESADIPHKGEFVVIVHGAEDQPGSAYEIDKLLSELGAHLPAKTVAAIAANLTGEKKNALYARLLELTNSS